MLDFLFGAQAVKVINKFFKEEASEEDFWEITKESYPNLKEDFRYMVDPQKLKDKYVQDTEAFAVTEEEKNHLLRGFELLRKYSETLPKNAKLSERILFAQKLLPRVLLDQEPPEEECKITPLQ